MNVDHDEGKHLGIEYNELHKTMHTVAMLECFT